MSSFVMTGIHPPVHPAPRSRAYTWLAISNRPNQ